MLIKLTAAKPLFPSSSSRLLASRYTPLHARHLASTHTPPRPAPPSSVRPRPSDISSASQSSQGDSAPQLKNPCPPPSPSSAPRLVRYDEAYYPYLSTPTSKALAAATATGSSSRIFGFRNSTASTSFENAARQERQAQVQAQAKAVKAAATQSLQALQKHEPDEMSKTKQESTVKASAVAEPQQHVKQRAAHSHAHSHGGHDHHHHEGSAEEAEKLLAALKGQGDRGSNITLLGLGANLVLCIAKTIAGVLLHSASLLADAAHSLSDMFSDIVTLFCWKMSRKPASASHPLGYGKYETMGGLGVSVVLVAGAVGIGAHSYGLLIEALEPTLRAAPAALQALGSFTGAIASKGAHAHDHAHDAAGLLDPNAMWFALASVAVKEWLYHATMKVAKDENSSVLEANAVHHRSDSLSSGVTFLAILGSWLGFPVLDPLGGLLVAGLIGKQGFELLIGALGDLSDRGVDEDVRADLGEAIEAVRVTNADVLKTWRDLRAVKHGVSTLVDVTLEMPPLTSLKDAHAVEQLVRKAVEEANKGVKEVRVRLDTAE